jgi:hypothetical protein
MGRGEACLGFWWGNLRAQKPQGRLGRRWKDNIQMGLQEVGCGGMEWIELAQVAGTCECGNESSGCIKCGDFLDWIRNG